MESKSQHPDLAPVQNRAHSSICLHVRMSVLLEELTVRRAVPQAQSPVPGLPPTLSTEMEGLSNPNCWGRITAPRLAPPSMLSPTHQPLWLPPGHPTSPAGGSALSCPCRTAPHPGPCRPGALTPGQRAQEPCWLSEPSSAFLLGFLLRPLSGLRVWPTWACVTHGATCRWRERGPGRPAVPFLAASPFDP